LLLPAPDSSSGSSRARGSGHDISRGYDEGKAAHRRRLAAAGAGAVRPRRAVRRTLRFRRRNFLAFAAVISTGSVFHWSWTGFNKDDQLWDLLHVLVLPVVLATLPLWYRTRDRWRLEWRAVLSAVVLVFVVLIVGSYGFGWAWTGFAGNTLWDWLELLALPVVVSCLPVWFVTHRELEREWRAAFGVLLIGLVVVVVGGYRFGWSWTGFDGNTVRDWLQLLVVPFLLPATLAWFGARREAARQPPAATDQGPHAAQPPVANQDADPAGPGDC
jgi:uncharacterized membrane protein